MKEVHVLKACGVLDIKPGCLIGYRGCMEFVVYVCRDDQTRTLTYFSFINNRISKMALYYDSYSDNDWFRPEFIQCIFA